MANGFKLGLLHWGNGDDVLSFEDYLHGEDETFVLTEEGAFRRTYDDNIDMGEDEGTLTPVNLVHELIALLRKLEQREDETEDDHEG